MAWDGLLCGDVPLRNYSLIQVLIHSLAVSAGGVWLRAQGQIPLCRLSSDFHDKSVMSPWRPARHREVCDFTVSPKSVCRVVSCSFPNSVRMTQTGLSPTCRGIFPNRPDVSQWFETPKLPNDIPISWPKSVTSQWQVSRSCRLTCDIPVTRVTGMSLGSQRNAKTGLRKCRSAPLRLFCGSGRTLVTFYWALCGLSVCQSVTRVHPARQNNMPFGNGSHMTLSNAVN